MSVGFAYLTAVLFPVIAGLYIWMRKPFRKWKSTCTYVGVALLVSLLFSVYCFCLPNTTVELFAVTDKLKVVFGLDEMGRIFLVLTEIVWLLTGIYSFSYMEKERHINRYFGCYLVTLGVLVGLCCSANLITMYAFYEFLTLASFLLVLHEQTHEAVMAALKYLFYSFFGAYCALFGIFFLLQYTESLDFMPGGILVSTEVMEHRELLLLCLFFMILGFGVKAGMFPLHAWLPTAHPVAPAPASAVLSGIIVKAGVLAIIRTVYYVFGASFVRDTWVQYAFLVLTLITVFMGSMLAFREPVLKKRLAYSTVSQLSYILFGIALLDTVSLTGSLFHVLAHGFIKVTLFLCAGAIIHQTGATRVDELRGIGKKMPVTIWCFTIVSLGLIGIPPTGGFISKWFLAVGALESEMKTFAIAGPVVLLVSALLTAGYLLPVTIRGFLPGDDFDYAKLKKEEPSLFMTVPILIMTVITVLLGICPNPVRDYITEAITLLF
ncbi:MAG: proton-conducting membrane transporter [Lachnospiraceae bacterium]|nr:proton-conducting membrane transporter [Lachnospiraceae bacterium]